MNINMDTSFSSLELSWRTRTGGSGKTARSYLDFIVDGQSIFDLLQPGDLIGCLGWQSDKVDEFLAQCLLGKQSSDLGNGRYSIYVCPECGDIDCGAITVQIQKTRQGYVWSQFGFENKNATGKIDLKSYENLGPFLFEKHEYWNTITNRPIKNAISAG